MLYPFSLILTDWLYLERSEKNSPCSFACYATRHCKRDLRSSKIPTASVQNSTANVLGILVAMAMSEKPAYARMTPATSAARPPRIPKTPSRVGPTVLSTSAMPNSKTASPNDALVRLARPISIWRTANAASKTIARASSEAADHRSTMNFNAIPSTACRAPARETLATVVIAPKRAHAPAAPARNIQDNAMRPVPMRTTPSSWPRCVATQNRSRAYSAKAAGASPGCVSMGCSIVATSSTTTPVIAETPPILENCSSDSISLYAP